MLEIRYDTKKRQIAWCLEKSRHRIVTHTSNAIEGKLMLLADNAVSATRTARIEKSHIDGILISPKFDMKEAEKQIDLSKILQIS